MNIHSTRLTKRHAEIVRMVRDRGTLAVSEVASALGVSEETVRRDVRPLVQRGEMVKLHGAVTLPHQVGEAPFERRLREFAEAKRAIAKRTAELVEDGDSLMLDTGTTTSIFAQELLKKHNLTIVTNSADIARTLATVNGNKVYMAGGELNGDNGAAFGPSTIAFVAGFRVRYAVVSIAALDAIYGPMDSHLAEAEFARMVLSRGEHRIMLSDSSKFGRTALIKVCEYDGIDRLVTEAAPPPDLAAALTSAGVGVDVAGH